MTDTITKIQPSDLISDSMVKINRNFEIISNRDDVTESKLNQWAENIENKLADIRNENGIISSTLLNNVQKLENKINNLTDLDGITKEVQNAIDSATIDVENLINDKADEAISSKLGDYVKTSTLNERLEGYVASTAFDTYRSDSSKSFAQSSRIVANSKFLKLPNGDVDCLVRISGEITGFKSVEDYFKSLSASEKATILGDKTFGSDDEALEDPDVIAKLIGVCEKTFKTVVSEMSVISQEVGDGFAESSIISTVNKNGKAIVSSIFVAANDKGSGITLNADNILINSYHNLNVQSGGNISVENGGNFTINSGGKFQIESNNFNIDEHGTVTVKGAIEAKSLKITGSDGSMVDISDEAKLANFVKGHQDDKWLKDALNNGTTTIDGGLVLSNAILTKDSDDNITAGMIGSNNTENDIRFFAGSNMSDINNAPFRVYSDGRLVATNAEISGDITTSQLIATSASGNRKTTINANIFEITSTGDTTSSLSITIIDDMSMVDGYDSAPNELKSAKNVPTLCMEYGEKKYYLWPGAWKSISGNTTNWESFEFFSHNTYESLGDYRLVSYLSELTKVLNSHFNSSDNDGSIFLEEIATYFIFSDAVALTKGSNLEQSGGSKLYFMTDLLTGVDKSGKIYSSQTDQATYNYLPVLHKNDGYVPEYSDEKWEKVKDFYADIKDGAYVKPGEKCNTIMVSELYDYATTSGYTLEEINNALGINTIVNGYMLKPHEVSYSSLCLKNNSTSLNYSHAGPSFGINLYETVCYDIAATGTTDDEKKIKNFVGNVSSKTEVSGSSYGGGEMTVLCYPLYNISYGTIQSAVKKCLYVIVATGTGSMSREDEGWRGGGEMSGQYDYGERTFHLTYLIDNEPYYDDSGNYISLSTTVSNNKKKILAKLIDKLGTANTGISKNSIEFVVRISTRENGQTFNNYTLFDGAWK